MLRKLIIGTLGGLFMLAAVAASTSAQSIVQDDSEYQNRGGGYEEARIDRFLDVEVWTDHSDGEYYSGDNIVVYFRANRDAFISIYSIDTRGRVNLLFPADPMQDNFIRGGVTYRLPGEDDGYDLEVTGPEGFENIQIIASRETFPIPNWYNNSGMVCDRDDRADYMDNLNSMYFVKYGGQRFAYDRAAIYVNEWEEYYYRPIYHPYYPSWTMCGNVYIDYPWGGTIYVNGVYWGCAPLYIPRIAIGWHTITVYDHYGYCWESDFHVSRYNTVIFNRNVVNPLPTVRSKYKEVRTVGYRDPVTSGYPTYVKKSTTVAGKDRSGSVITADKGRGGPAVDGKVSAIPKKYTVGSGKLVKTDRGYESDISGAVYSNDKSGKIGSTSRPGASYGRKTTTKSANETSSGSYRKETSGRSSTGSYEKGSTGSRSGSRGSTSAKSNTESSSGSGYYQRKSGSSSRGSSSARSGSSSSGSSTSRSGSRSGSSSSGSKSKSSGSARQSSGSTPPAQPSAPPSKSGGSSEKQSSGGSYHQSGGSSSSSSGSGSATPKSSRGNSGARSGSGKSKR